MHTSADFFSVVFALLAKGFTVEMKMRYKASYVAIVRDSRDAFIGELQYRDPQDEPKEYAQGLSYDTDTGLSAAIAAIYIQEKP